MGFTNRQSSGGGLTSPVAIADGGTGATTAALARTALGLGTAATAATGDFAAASHAHAGTDITSGTVADARLTANVTLLGNTFNGASQLVQMTAATKLPAVDGSLLTNLPAGSPPGVNVESLSAGKTLTYGTDDQYQFLNPNGGDRDITLDTASGVEGATFTVVNNGSYSTSNFLTIKQGGTTLDILYARNKATYLFYGSGWLPVGLGTGLGSLTGNLEDGALGIGPQAKAYNLGTSVGSNSSARDAGAALGRYSSANSQGAAVGHSASADTNGAAVGYNASAGSYGAALGHSSSAAIYGVAIGYGASAANNHGIAKGVFSKAERYGEEVRSTDEASTQKNSYSSFGFQGVTTDATPAELLLLGVAAKRLTLLAQSALAFRMIAVAYDDAGTQGATWSISGGIRRDGANNTALIGTVVKTMVSNDAGMAAADITVTADDTNESLKVEVTGIAATTIHWAVKVEASEVRY